MQVWSPYLAKDIQKLESVQKFALKVCLKKWNCSYDEFLRESGISELSDRRKLLSLMYLYKAANGLMTVPDGIVVPRLCAHNTRLSSQVTFVQPFARTNTYHHSFFPSIISLWNSLPKSVVTVPSVMSFKHNLSSYISNNN